MRKNCSLRLLHTAIIVVVAFILFIDSPRAAAADHETNVPVGAAVEISLEKKQWRLGEPIIALFHLKNSGVEPFTLNTGGDYRGGGFPSRYKVVFIGEDGKALPEHPDLSMAAFGGGFVQTKKVEPGKVYDERVPLNRYVLIRMPGKYKVKVWHDFGWKIDPQMPHPIAETEVELIAPTEEWARQRVMQLKDAAMSSDYSKLLPALNEYAQMHFPIYVPALMEQALAGNKAALEGLRRIDSASATEAMLKIIEAAPSDTAEVILHELVRRSPGADPKEFSWFKWPLSAETTTWSDTMKERARAIALKKLNEDDTNAFKIGGKLITCFGQKEDGDTVIVALAKEMKRQQKPRTLETDDVLDDPGAISELTGALKALKAKGFCVPVSGGVGVILAQFRDWSDEHSKRPKQWQDSIEAFSTGNDPMLSLFAVRALPPDLPERLVPTLKKLLENADRGVQLEACKYVTRTKDVRFGKSVLATLSAERESWLLQEAFRAASATGLRFEAVQALSERLPEINVGDIAFNQLVEVIRKTGSSGGTFQHPREKRLAMREAWRKVLANPVHRESIIQKKPLDISDDEAHALLGGEYFFDLPDGKQWPKK